LSADFLAFARRWWWLLAIGVVLATACTLFVSALVLPRVYEAQARVLITPDEAGGAGADLAAGLSIDQLIATYSAIIQTRSVLDAVAAETPGLSSDDLARAMTVGPDQDTELLDIAVRWKDPSTAATLANRVATTAIGQVQASRSARLADRASSLATQADELAGVVAQRSRALETLRAQSPDPGQDEQVARAQTAVDQAYQAYTNALALSDGVRLAQANSGAVLSLVDAAMPGPVPILPRPAVDAFTGGVIGLLVALAVAWLLELLFDPLPGLAQLQRLIGVPVFGTIGMLDRSSGAQFGALSQPLSTAAAEVFRLLRVALPRDDGTLLVTSAADGDGKTNVATGLAVALAQADQRVILVDANLTRPGLDAVVHGVPHIGLSTLLTEPDVSAASVLVRTHLPRLQLLRAGRPSPNLSDLLASAQMRFRLIELRGLADVVIIDGAVMNSDTLALATSVDNVIWVVDSRRSTSRATRRMAMRFKEAGTASVGLVINRSCA
jgi:capsular polysaccharide biosynthesis protein/Mrp family chromosome partitioning ATPase